MKMKTGKVQKFLVLSDSKKGIGGRHVVFLDYVPIVSFHTENVIERKMAVIQLMENKHCSQKITGDITGFHSNTVYNILRTKRILGIEAVIEDNRGLKSPYKYIGELRSHIKKLLRIHPDWSDQAIADHAATDLKRAVSRSAVARIRTEKQDRKLENRMPSKADLVAMAQVADSIDRRNYDDRQMQLRFIEDEEVKAKSDECGQEPLFKPVRESDQRLVERLQAGVRFNFCGALMHHLFLTEVDLEKIVSAYPLNPGVTYQSLDILNILFHGINIGISSIEAFKRVNSAELGVVIGMNQAPEKETIRKHLDMMSKHHLSGDLVDRFAKRLMERNFIDPAVFFIDGHFLPYYGLNVIAKGYYTVRRLAMRGNELYAISDLQGRPLFFITESNEVDFRPIILRSAAKLREYGVDRPVLVFDRGGYGIHFFSELNEISDFITWAKYVGEQALMRIPKSSFTVGIWFKDKRYHVAEEIRTVTESVQTANNDGRSTPTSITLRMVVLENAETGKRIPIYTNNTAKPLQDIAYHMLNRWGDSENFFKEMMARFNLNYHPGYDIKELENQPLVDNPDIILIKKAIRILRKEIEEMEKEILVANAQQMQRQDRRRQERISKTGASIIEKKQEIAGFEAKLPQLPEKVSILDILKGKPMSRCDMEKKKLYDLMQFVAYNSRERLVELFRDCYDDHRDVKQVLDMITGKAGYIKLFGQTLIVTLDWIETKKHREAAERFCRLLNQKTISLCGRVKFKLAFYVSKYPLHSSDDATSTTTF